MKKLLYLQKALLILIAILLAGSLVSCMGETETRPRVWIDSPRGGASITVGAPVFVLSHAYAREGIAEVVLYVNSTAYQRAAPGNAGLDFSEFSFEWTPPGPGDYSLQLWVYDTRGETGDPATIALHVGGETVVTPPDPIEASPSLIATLVVTTPPTLVPTTPPTLVPSPTNPPPRPTNTATSPPPPPQDTTPPPPPSPAVPADGLVVSCRSSQTLAWLPVQDPSGIDGYYVLLQREVTAGNWQDVNSWGPVGGKQVDASVDCGIKYRWRVRARDGAGNYSNWSAFSKFAIDLT